jgi:hypothetical protein
MTTRFYAMQAMAPMPADAVEIPEEDAGDDAIQQDDNQEVFPQPGSEDETAEDGGQEEGGREGGRSTQNEQDGCADDRRECPRHAGNAEAEVFRGVGHPPSM